MNDSLSQSLRSGNSLTSAQANAARLANNKKIVFTDKQEMYRNHTENTATGAGISTTQDMTRVKKTIVGGSKKAIQEDDKISV